MKIFKSYTYTWWQLGILKTSLLLIGCFMGAYWNNVFNKEPLLITLLAIGLLLAVYIIYISFKNKD